MSGEWVSHTLDVALRIEVVPAPVAASAEIEAAVERSWAAARAERPALFNGRIFSALEVGRARITGFWTDYSRALAQIRAPELFGALRIRALAVNGVIVGPDGIVFGQRQARAVYQPGMWQCPPAGSIEARAGEDAVDLRAQLLAELEEELGMPADAVRGFRPLAAVEHPGSHVIDLGVALTTSWDRARIGEAHRRFGNAECERLAFVPRAEVAARLAAWGERVVPPARVSVAALSEGAGGASAG